MINYRQGIFETNSSSTHAMIVGNTVPSDFPNYLHFALGEYGWEHNILSTPEEKASYLYTAAVILRDDYEVRQTLTEMLSHVEVAVDFDMPQYEFYTYNGERHSYLTNAGIDHVGEDDQEEFVNDMLTNLGDLLCYLFSDESYVITGNDNCTDEQYDWFHEKCNPSYEHKVYYKGN